MGGGRPGDTPLHEGILGTAASLRTDLVLLLEIGMAVGLLFGGLLARRHHYRAHAWCQSLLVLCNLMLIFLFMVPAFRLQVAPKIPSRLGKPYFAFAAAHAALGAMVELAALYILLAAGTKWLPENLRLRRYRPWMRAVLAAWWLELLLGIVTYLRWYMPQLFRH